MDVACLGVSSGRRHLLIRDAMVQGVRAAGDMPVRGLRADVAVAYGWKNRAHYARFPSFVYADLGYWQREAYYRFAVNGWSPERYVRAGRPSDRFERLGLTIKPWRAGGREIIVAGCTQKAASDHGLEYQAWEASAIQCLQGCGRPVVYRPKPNDQNATPFEGVEMDRRPISEALATAYAVVTHHSNTAIDALLAGIPVHCETGAAAALSVPLDQIADAPLLDGREQFLHDVAWLQWTVDEMRSGEAWAYLRTLL